VAGPDEKAPIKTTSINTTPINTTPINTTPINKTLDAFTAYEGVGVLGSPLNVVF